MARRWFQIHLSTALVLMLVAAGLLWLNLRLRHTYSMGGWPWKFYGGLIALDSEEAALISTGLWSSYPRPIFSFTNLFLNICVALAILAATAVVCENFARRKQTAG